MAYKGWICGVTGERFTFKIPVSIGCPYNKCAFCDLYKHREYREIPLEDIEAEIMRVRDAGGKPERIMLGDGNPLWLPFERLKTIFSMIEQNLPSCASVCCDASIQAIADKTDDELAWLSQHGLRTVYVGIESGLDDVLSFMSKDHDNAEARKHIARLHVAGIDFGAHIMMGVAGAGRGIENARATVQLVNELQPTYICNFPMGIGTVTELGLLEEDGLFVRASRQECMEEQREMLSLLHPDAPMRYEGYYITRLRKPGTRAGGADGLREDDFMTRTLILKGDLSDEADRERIITAIEQSIRTLQDHEARFSSVRAADCELA